MNDEKSEGETPVDHGHVTNDDKGQHPGNRPGRTQQAHRLGLLRAFVMVGNQGNQRRHERGPRKSRQSLPGQHHAGRRTQHHGHHGGKEEPDRHLKKDFRAETLAELSPQHHEARNAERIHHDGRSNRCRRGVEAVDHAAHGNRQGRDVEGHQHLAHGDDHHRKPRGVFFDLRAGVGSGLCAHGFF